MLKAPSGGLAPKDNKRKEAKWVAPPRGRPKLKFDGDSKRNLRLVHTECVVRNDEGRCVGAISTNMGVATNNEVETEVVKSLQKFKDFSIQHVYKEAKRCADLLANFGASQNEKVIIDLDLDRWNNLSSILDEEMALSE
ncbi:hypothetical protein SUGI_0593830 [Cryptomeria japonica]|nr:hypothetical protein SUGI_0593830 [Cryptomeria japonica]